MTPHRLPSELKKSHKITVLMTEAEMDKLTRAALFHNMSKSVMANNLIVAGLRDVPGIGDAEIAEVAEKQESWRERMGLK